MQLTRRLSLAILLAILSTSAAWSQPATVYPPTEKVRADFLKQLDRPRVPLDPQVKPARPYTRGLTIEHVSLAVEKRADGSTERVPAIVVKAEATPASQKLPVVLVLHGTGGTKEGNRSWLEDLARRGFLAVSFDGRFHGERSDGIPGTRSYNAAITEAWRSRPGMPQTHPFYYDTCWDLWRTIDYLVTRADVDAERIGVIGISKGGIETWLGAAADERVKVAVPAISVQSFRWSLEHDRWQGRASTIQGAHDAAAADLGEPKVNQRVCRELWSKVIPGILDEFDCPSMLRLFAGRPLLIVSGDSDPNCPVEGAQLAVESAREAFQKAGAADKLKVMIARNTGHAITKEQREAALDWFTTWLRPTKP